VIVRTTDRAHSDTNPTIANTSIIECAGTSAAAVTVTVSTDANCAVTWSQSKAVGVDCNDRQAGGIVDAVDGLITGAFNESVTVHFGPPLVRRQSLTLTFAPWLTGS
jgi:hypothetical protein